MTILDRNSGTFAAATSFNVTRSSGSYGTGTVIVIAVFSNTIVSTPSGWTQRLSSVVDLGLYSYDKTGAGESSIAFSCSTGSGVWFAWELSASSTFLSPGSASQNNSGAISFTSGALTPTAGDRHLLVASGGVGSGNARTVTSFSDSFTEWADAQATAQDWPFAAGADLDVTADGSTAYSTTATFSGTAQAASGAIFLAYVNAASGGGVAATGRCVAVVAPRSAASRTHAVSCTVAAAVTARATTVHRTAVTATGWAVAVARAAAAKRNAATGRAVVAMTTIGVGGQLGSTRAATGRCTVAVVCHSRIRRRTSRPNAGITVRPNAGITYRP